jgi:hypothetical protein
MCTFLGEHVRSYYVDEDHATTPRLSTTSILNIVEKLFFDATVAQKLLSDNVFLVMSHVFDLSFLKGQSADDEDQFASIRRLAGHVWSNIVKKVQHLDAVATFVARRVKESLLNISYSSRYDLAVALKQEASCLAC